MTVRISGLNETVRHMKALGVEVGDLKKAFKAIGNKVVATGSQLAPHRSGKLAAGIKASNTVNKSVVRVGGVRLPYAGAIHWGWPARNIEAQPFLTKAVEMNHTEALIQIERDLKDLIKKYSLDG